MTRVSDGQTQRRPESAMIRVSDGQMLGLYEVHRRNPLINLLKSSISHQSPWPHTDFSPLIESIIDDGPHINLAIVSDGQSQR